MKIGAILPQSLIDYPGKVSAVFFTIGCNFKCPYCYNTKLALGKIKQLTKEKIEHFLEERKNFINAVVLSGGEPLLQKDIVNFAKKIKKHNLLFGIETNGSQPKILEKLLKEKLLDFVAMDIKSDFDSYKNATGVNVNKENILKSINLLKKSKIQYEFRITAVPKLIKKTELKKISKLVRGSKVVLQQFVNDKDMIDNKLKKLKPYSSKKLEEFKEALSECSKVEIRIS
ncbi:MAG: anaerobic ribonucleoside-triphosphate reductase activating protein [Candidatus Woesearchaeota archaeon]|nr:MAG: anaerobic ribonucleoside-triphosphate reductase activating protein [Candidatus Woesearchaeota archaeon]